MHREVEDPHAGAHAGSTVAVDNGVDGRWGHRVVTSELQHRELVREHVGDESVDVVRRLQPAFERRDEERGALLVAQTLATTGAELGREVGEEVDLDPRRSERPHGEWEPEANRIVADLGDEPGDLAEPSHVEAGQRLVVVRIRGEPTRVLDEPSQHGVAVRGLGEGVSRHGPARGRRVRVRRRAGG
jgi:hypothetical protein